MLRFAGEARAANRNNDRAGEQIKWVGELMAEERVRALPRSMELLGRCYDSLEFWAMFDLMPVRSGI